MQLGKKKTFMDHAAEFAETALESIESAYEIAKENAIEAGSNAKDAAGPKLQDAKDRAVPLIAAGSAVAIEKATAGAALAREQASHSKELASAKLAGLTSEPEPAKGGKLKKFLIISGLLAVGGLIFKRIRDQQASDNWQSSYVPPAPATAAAPTPSPTDGLADPLTDPLPGQAGDDPGGAGPDEALSDAVESPHPVTTPDDPAEVVELGRADEEGMTVSDESSKK